MAGGNREALIGAVATLRRRGVDLARVYPIARERHPSAPTLDEVESAHAAAVRHVGQVR